MMQREDVDRLAHYAAMLGIPLGDEHAALRDHHETVAATLRALLAERDAAYRAGYRDGFSVTGEGGNQEYPWDQFGRDPEQDEDWLWQRESLLEKYKARPE